MKPVLSCYPLRCVKRWALLQGSPQLQVFEKLWGTNELLSSFDSINCLPPSIATGVPNDQTSWLHADQAPLRRGFFCIQVTCITQDSAKPHGSSRAVDGLLEQHHGFRSLKRQLLWVWSICCFQGQPR